MASIGSVEASEIVIALRFEFIDQMLDFYLVYDFVRPFGCFILLAAYDSNGPQLYGVELSGVTYIKHNKQPR
ncbi:unnamed protein product [Rotaria sordida]|uniref:Uncharacterized protein n=1 Tax=Rotaria sordida TaxID=392033 RepID=A0A814AQ04_9BILA|nr:unnamed protein product [Rotaria sordida]CAF0918107.1 unnamed protein product [Rotaria sordida]